MLVNQNGRLRQNQNPSDSNYSHREDSCNIIPGSNSQ